MTMVPAQKLSRKQQLQQKYHHHHHHHQHNSTDLDHHRLVVVVDHQKGNSSSSTYGGCGGNHKSKVDKVRRSSEEEEEEEYWCLGNMSRAAETGTGNEYCSAESDIVAGPMADQDESRTNSLNNNNNNNNEAAASSNSKEDEANVDLHQESAADEQGSWLQLSIGGHTADQEDLQAKSQPAARSSNVVELDLLAGGGGSSRQGTLTRSAAFEAQSMERGGLNVVGRGIFGSNSNTPLMYFQQYPVGGSSTTGSANYFVHQQQDPLNWASFRPLVIPQNIPNYSINTSSSSSSSSSLLMPLLPQSSSISNPYLARQFQHQTPVMLDASAGPSLDFRVVNPPRRPHSGIWFTLQASQNQAKEPFLPQISKSFLRIKDGRMTVRLLIKYLVNKLRLDNESEIEITCRGQQLLPFMTLQHIRDNIWAPTLTLLNQNQDSSITDHLMVLHYSRSA